MRKNVFILIGILIGLYTVLTLIDTGEYRVEKRLWRMQKKYAEIAQDPKTVPDAQFERVIQDYRKLIKKYPESGYVPQMYSSIGMLYTMNKKYEQARKTFGQVVTEFSESPMLVSRALMEIGNLYLIEGNIPTAVDTFRRAWKDYSDTPVGFMMPMHIAGVYRQAKQPEKSQEYLAEAVTFYKGVMSDEEKADLVRINAYQALVSAYIGLQDWPKALEFSRKILYDFADSEVMTPQILGNVARTINILAIVRFNDHDAARKIYLDFINDHPDHLLNPFIGKILETVDFLEKKSLEESDVPQI